MKKTKLLPLFLALGLIFTGCSSEDTDSDSASNSSTQEESSIFGNIFSGGDSSTSADEMRLENYTGSITVQNNSVEKTVVLGSRLVTGDNIETMMESNAFVVLDQSKVLRVNETSQVEIIQEEEHLDIYLSKGTVFFNVTSTLSEDETLEFHTNNVVTGVRGTSGIIHFDAENQVTQIVVLTGTVTGTTASEEQNIEAGQVAIVETLPDGTVEMTLYELEENDPLYYFADTFVDGIQGDLNGEGQSLPLSDMVRESNDPLMMYDLYAQVLADLAFEAENGDYNNLANCFYMLYDMTEDGIPELFTRGTTYYAAVDIHYIHSGNLLTFPEVYRYNDSPVAWFNGAHTGSSFDRVGLTTSSDNYVFDETSIDGYPSGRDGIDLYYYYIQDGEMMEDYVHDPAGSFNYNQTGVHSTPLPENWYNIADFTGLDQWINQ
ncbi:MAG: FecR domain-containing protein [Eubacteriales bacterium]